MCNNSKKLKSHVFWILKKRKKNVKNVSIGIVLRSPTSNTLLRSAECGPKKVCYGCHTGHSAAFAETESQRLTHFEHVARMGNSRYPNILLHGYGSGQRARGRPKKKWVDNIKEDCTDMGY